MKKDTQLTNSNKQNSLVVQYSKKKRGVFPVKSLSEASEICRKFIDANNLGASEWYGGSAGFVFDINGKQVANISYNGRIWDMKDKEVPKEIANKNYY